MRPWKAVLEAAERMASAFKDPKLGQFVGTEQAEVQYDVLDFLTRRDVGDAVDPETTPDGVHWRFDHPQLLGKRFTIRGARVVAVADVFRDPSTGHVMWARRGELPE
jgi:hypothetical protein